MPRKRSTAGKRQVFLRLKQNHFVGGKVALKGTEHPFSPEEAKRRLKTTRLWETV